MNFGIPQVMSCPLDYCCIQYKLMFSFILLKSYDCYPIKKKMSLFLKEENMSQSHTSF